MFDYIDGKKRFLDGREAVEEAEKMALDCGQFRQDYEEECFYDEPVTCYNCRWRRWTEKGFDCMKKD